MKVKIMTEEKGVLTSEVSKRSTKKEAVYSANVFPISSLYKWYPFNTNYAYVVDKHGVYRLTELDDCIHTSYNLVSEEKAKLDPTKWHNKTVTQSNLLLCRLANKLGIKSIKDDFNQQDVENGFEVVSTELAYIKEQATARCYGDKDVFERSELLKKSKEEREQAYFEYLTVEEVNFQYKLGELYAMLVLMRKVVNY